MDGKGINTLCRICLSNSFLHSNIYVSHSADTSPIYEVINFVYDLQICVEDGLPEFVCYECLSLVKKFELYKTNAHKAKSELLYLKEKIDQESGCIYETAEDEPDDNKDWRNADDIKEQSCDYKDSNCDREDEDEESARSPTETQVFIKQEKMDYEFNDENYPEDVAESGYEEGQMTESHQPVETQLQFVNTEKRKRKLYLEGHLYFKDKEKDEKIYWKCEKYQKLKCKARVMTVGNSVSKRSNAHNHTTDDSRVEASKILSIIQGNAMNTNESPQNIISQACVGFSQEAIASLPKLDAIKRTIRNIRMRYGAGLVDKADGLFGLQCSNQDVYARQEC